MSLFSWLTGSAPNSDPTQIKAVELLQQIRGGQKPYIVDVRESRELAGPLGALPGVKNIPLSEFGQRFGEVPKDRPVILVCQSGHRSGMALRVLQSKGYTQIHNVAGGMLAVRRTQEENG